MSRHNLRRQFLDPHNRFRFCPFWFLNHDLEAGELRWQLQEMNRQGAGGAILHPRHGLLTPWMSHEWLDLMGECIDECCRQDMKAYLYDENNWPSGPADGQIYEGHPEFRMSHVRLTQTFEVRGGRRLREQLDPREGLLAVVAVPYADEEPVDFPASAQLLLADVEEGPLDWTAPAGHWRVFVFTRKWHAGTFFGSYADVLSADAMQRFREIAYEPYAERFSEHFGATIDGIFTDEPSMGAPCVWTPRLPGEFEHRSGYPLLTALPALFQDMGPLSARIRCDYFRTVTHLWVTNYMRPLYEFCEARGLNFMGHMLCDGELGPQVMCNGDYFETVKYLSWAGLDYLTLATWPDETDTGSLNNVAVCKFATSSADFYDRPVTFSECFGLAAQWAVTLRDLKWMTDFQCVQGVNLLGPHAFYYSIQGFRKFECPPGEFYQSPFWPYYRAIADYAGRLCALLREGKHLADLALFYPNRSIWAETVPGSVEQPWEPTDVPGPKQLEINFNLATSALLKLGYDYDILPEQLLQEADFSAGRLSVAGGRMTFQALVLPALTCVERATAEALLAYTRAGGRLLALGSLPTKSSEAGEDPHIQAIFREIFGEDYDLSLTVPGASGPVLSVQDLSDWSGGVLVGAPPGTVTEDLAEPLLTALRHAAPPDVLAESAGRPVFDIVHYHYQREGLDFVLLVNTSREQEHAFTLHLPFSGEVEVWDLDTGESAPCTVARGTGAGLEIPLSLPPVGSLLLAVDRERRCPSTPVIAADLPVERVDASRAVGLAFAPGTYSVTVGGLSAPPREVTATVGNLPETLELTGPWEFATLRPNALPLTEWQLEIDNRVTGTDSDHAGLRYRATFEAEILPAEARLLLDGIAGDRQWRRSHQLPYEVLLNGHPLEFAPGDYLDHQMYEASLEGLLEVGTNRLEILTRESLSEPATLTQPPLVLGRFAVAAGRRPRLVAEPGAMDGPWDEGGYPYYSGIGLYRQEFTLTRAQAAARLFLELDAPGDLVEVLVNGESCGVRPWEPWRLEVTAAVKSGKNLLELRIANSLQNLLVQEPKPSGLLSSVRLVPCREVEFDLT